MDGTIKIYEAISGRETMSFPGHNVTVGSLAFSPDGKYLASGDGLLSFATGGKKAHEVVIWDMTSGVAKHTLYGHHGAIHSVAFSPDGETLASASQDGTVRIWSVTDGKTLRVIHGHSQKVIGAAFSPTGDLLATASADNTIKLWNMSSVPKGHIVCRHDGAVTCVAFSPDSRRLASASADRTVAIWDAENGTRLAVLQGHEDTVRSVAFSPDNSYLVSVSSDQTLRVWELPSGKEILSIPAHTSPIYDVAVSSDATLVATAGEDNYVGIWNARSGKELHRINLPFPRSVAFGPDSHRLAAAVFDRVVYFIDADSKQELGRLSSQVSGLLSVRFSHDGRRLVLASDRNSADVWNLPTSFRGSNWSTKSHWAFTLDGHTGAVPGAVFSPDDRRIATASHDGTVRIWDAGTGQEALTLRGHAGAVQCVAFSPDGRLLASADTQGTVIIWDGKKQ
jgi:WD40 repeat protein